MRDDAGIVPYKFRTVSAVVCFSVYQTVNTVILFHQGSDFFAEDNLLNIVGVIKTEHADRD